eukprot:scaffold64307_cov69-Phaeocystis_antarctica.AAC.2
MKNHAEVAASLRARTAAAKAEAVACRQKHKHEVALLAAQLEQLRARLGVLGTDKAQLVQRRDALQSEQRALHEELNPPEEAAAATAGSVDPARLRKSDLLALQSELKTRQDATEAAAVATAALKDECSRVGVEGTALQAEHGAAERKNKELQAERDVLFAKARDLGLENAAMAERVRALDSEAEQVRERDEKLSRELHDARDDLRDAQSQVENLTADTQKLRARVGDKEAAVQKGHAELAVTSLSVDETEAEGVLRLQQLGEAQAQLAVATEAAGGAASRVAKLEVQVQPLQLDEQQARGEALEHAKAKAHAETLARQLQMRLDEIDAEDPMAPTPSAEAAAFAPLGAGRGVLPRVPVLASFVETLAETSRDISRMAEVTLKGMSK